MTPVNTNRSAGDESPKVSLIDHLPVSGWRDRARTGSRKRITRPHARPRPLRHGSQAGPATGGPSSRAASLPGSQSAGCPSVPFNHHRGTVCARPSLSAEASLDDQAPNGWSSYDHLMYGRGYPITFWLFWPFWPKPCITAVFCHLTGTVPPPYTIEYRLGPVHYRGTFWPNGHY